MDDQPDQITGAFWYGGRSFRLQLASGIERVVKRDEFIAAFQRLYPQRRLPWEGVLPTNATME